MLWFAVFSFYTWREVYEEPSEPHQAVEIFTPTVSPLKERNPLLVKSHTLENNVLILTKENLCNARRNHSSFIYHQRKRMIEV